MAASTCALGCSQQAGPNVPLRKPRWSRKYALTPMAVALLRVFCTEPQYSVVMGPQARKTSSSLPYTLWALSTNSWYASTNFDVLAASPSLVPRLMTNASGVHCEKSHVLASFVGPVASVLVQTSGT